MTPYVITLHREGILKGIFTVRKTDFTKRYTIKKGTPISHRHAFKNYDSKKKQLNEFIYVESLHLLGCGLSFCQRSARFIQTFADQAVYLFLITQLVREKR